MGKGKEVSGEGHTVSLSNKTGGSTSGWPVIKEQKKASEEELSLDKNPTEEGDVHGNTNPSGTENIDTESKSLEGGMTIRFGKSVDETPENMGEKPEKEKPA